MVMTLKAKEIPGVFPYRLSAKNFLRSHCVHSKRAVMTNELLSYRFSEAQFLRKNGVNFDEPKFQDKFQ